MNIALLGFGTVGSHFYKLCEGRTDLHVAAVLSRRPRPELTCTVTADYDEIVRDPSIDIVVEVMGGIEPAYSYLCAAMRAGKHVVTANKQLMCAHFEELTSLAKGKGVALRCTAAAGGGIPWLTSLSRASELDEIKAVEGILNGTTNYMLSAMTNSGADYAPALRKAQELGYAEANPTLDIDGQDAAHKLTLLIRLAFGVDYPFTVLPVQGIRGMAPQDIAMARVFGYRVKLVAQVNRVNMDEPDDGPIRLEAGVFPALVPQTYLLARVGGVYNAVRVESESSGSLFFHGRGAGALPTASVVLGDLMAVARGELPNNTGFAGGDIPRASIVPPSESVSKYYVRTMVPDAPGVLRDLAGCMAAEGISIAQVIQKRDMEDVEFGEEVVPLVFMTHEASARAMRQALQHALDKGLLHSPAVYYRVL